MKNEITMMYFYYELMSLSLNLSFVEGKKVDFFDIDNIYFGGVDDINLCDLNTNSFRSSETPVPDLTGPEVTVMLSPSFTPANSQDNNLEMKISLLKAGEFGA